MTDGSSPGDVPDAPNPLAPEEHLPDSQSSSRDETGGVARHSKSYIPAIEDAEFLQGNDARGIRLPLFLAAFVALVAVNNLGWIPATAAAGMDEVSRACFVLAIVALGMKTSFKGLLGVGWKPMALVIAESAFIGLLVLGWIAS
mgnify:CR=1 FL=1